MNFLQTTIYRIILKTYMFFEETGRQNSFERFPYLRVLTERLTKECIEAWQNDTGMEAFRYHELLYRICRKEGDVDYCIVCNALDLCLAAVYVQEFAVYLNYYTGNIVTIQLASELEGVTYSDYGSIMGRLQKLQKVCSVDRSKNILPYATIEIDDVLLSYLTGADNLFPELYPGQVECFQCDSVPHPMFIRQNYAVEGAKWLQNEAAAHTATTRLQNILFQSNILQIRGAGGRRFLARHIAHLLKKDMILIDMKKCKNIMTAGSDEEHFWSRLAHAAFLKNAVVCLYNITASMLSLAQIDTSDLISTTIMPFSEANIPLILCTDTKVLFSSDERLQPHLHHITLGETTRQEREAVFRGFSELYHLPIDCVYHSVKYQLTASEISDAVMRWRCSGQTGPEDFSAICNDFLYNDKNHEQNLGQILYPSVGFKDLILPTPAKKILEQICCGAAKGYQLFEEWNLKRQYPYGRSVTVLLYGPSGTGKTMTAHAIAKELGTALYQVDLSHVLDKYIGETEKHLDQVFAFAQKARPVLFFDEADSLFGKRGEVKDGKDRYANMEVSYILQRIEQFDGIVILATNFYSGIDKAFLRRMKYVIKYQSPDAAMRRSIWEDCLPPELPREDLDLDYLAKQFDFTGGIIKNVVYTSCVMALQDRKKLCMEHVLNAVRAEYEKLERPVTNDMWGEYGEMMC